MIKARKRALGVACLGAVAVASDQSSAVTLTYREGLNGYAGTQDTWFSERTNGETDGFPEGNFIRSAQWASANQQSLLKFDGIFGGLGVPLGSSIDNAMLTLTIPSDITYADGEANAVHQMLVDWEETDAYGATQWVGGATQGIDRDGVEAATIAVADSTSFAVGGVIPAGTTLTYDVTPIVQSWSNGAGNHGFLLQSLGLAAGNGLFMASSEYAGEAQRPTLDISFQSDTATTLELLVNTATGSVSLRNETGISLDDIDYYRITSGAGALNPSGWNSLEDQDLAALPSGSGSGDGWEELGTPSGNALVEAYLTGSSDFANGLLVNLGNAFMPGQSTDNMEFLYRYQGNYVAGEIEFTTEAVEGDYNNDGIVNLADYTVWRNTLGATGPSLAADGDGSGTVDSNDYTYWKARFGNTSNSASLQASAQVVPEPATFVILATVGVAVLMVRNRRVGHRRLASAALAMVLPLSTTALAEVANERNYTFGDDAFEDASPNITVGQGTNNVAQGRTLDSGDPGDPDFTYIDIDVEGSPTYVDVTSRPGATPGSLGASFNGSSDYLSTNFNLNRPNDFWDDISFFPEADYALNYDTLFSHGVQLWAKPNPSGLGQSQEQDIVTDTDEAGGVYITANDTWGMSYDDLRIDSGEAVDTSGHGWTHLMQAAGLVDTTGGKFASGAALWVDGVAVATNTGAYESQQDQPLVIGANLAGDGNFYNGTLDDLRVFLWGDNSTVAPGVVGQLGMDYGSFNLGEDNDWIVEKLDELGVTNIADVNLNGVVFGDGSGPAETDDVTAFIEGWLQVRTVDGFQIGDWISRQNGDLNYDGITDYKDAVILHQGLVEAGAGGLNFSLLNGGSTVPEPATAMWLIAASGVCVVFRWCRRGETTSRP
ncbi:DNRLRE domain-containing protein [Aeoliella sp.]|uniref:DNRLRE domain-containing protein n=1 Tax=Aeoliella sp. TaxID=2795800 RepID=UPI003CCBED0B